MRRALLLALALALSGCGSGSVPSAREQPPTVVVPSPSAAHVASVPATVRVRFEGAVQVPARELARVVCIDKHAGVCRVGAGVTREEVIERDALLVAAAYYDRGFIFVTVDHRVEPAEGGVEVVYTIEEHEPYDVRAFVAREEDEHGKAVEMVGGTKAWNERFGKLVGERFNRSAIAAELESLRRAYRDAGYAMVEADPLTRIAKDERTITLTVLVKRNDMYRIERVRVLGDTRGVVRPVVASLEGTPYGETKLEDARRAVEALGFQSVAVAMKLSGPGKLEISVEVE
jgi:outer membrane protein assembly factor BamA